jgi:hypothetical protein
MNALLENITVVVGIVAGMVVARAAAELIVRSWDKELHETRGRRLDRWT